MFKGGQSPGMFPGPTLANTSALKPGIFPEERRKCLWWSLLNAYFMFGEVFNAVIFIIISYL